MSAMGLYKAASVVEHRCTRESVEGEYCSKDEEETPVLSSKMKNFQDR